MAETIAYRYDERVTVFGLYGLPGVGKSHLLDSLKRILGLDHFIFFEGSEVIANIVPGGLEAFKALQEQEKVGFRERAISSIRADCTNYGKAGVVTGHYMFWSDADDQGTPVCTQRDLEIYTHIVYLDTPAEVIAQQCRDDAARSRPSLSVEHLQRWQAVEKTELRRACYQNGILFSVIHSESVKAVDISQILQHFRQYRERNNLHRAEQRLDQAIEAHGQPIKSMLMLDGDKTMAAEDTGLLFWKNVHQRRGLTSEGDPLKSLFGSPLGYSHTAFHQATLLFEEWTDPHTFAAVCTEVAGQVMLYPEIASLLRLVRAEKHAGAVVVTCGLRLIWQKVLEMNGFADQVQVIGGGRLSDGLVVDAAVKAALATRMRQHHQLFITAFGDSVLDLPMLSTANQAVIVVGDEQSRSRTMDAALAEWIENKGLRVRQALLGPDATPRLDYERLPPIRLTDTSFTDTIFPHRHGSRDVHVVDLTDSNAAKVLMTPMRDAANSGTSLQNAHHHTGWYLATHALLDSIGIEEYPIPHVQGIQTLGYRLAGERCTLIVALMRGGEPMALGVKDAFPLASFLKAKQVQDVTEEHVRDKSTVILVDSVVNSGQTMTNFIYHVHHLAPKVPIVMVAGVVQTQAFRNLQQLQETIRHRDVRLVALRKSENRYVGKGSTDTGNRLFNTMQLP